jgi:hypothetical protein
MIEIFGYADLFGGTLSHFGIVGVRISVGSVYRGPTVPTVYHI